MHETRGIGILHCLIGGKRPCPRYFDEGTACGPAANAVPNTHPPGNFNRHSPAQPFVSDQNAGCPGAKHWKGFDSNEGPISFLRGRLSSKDELEEGFLLEDSL